MLARAPAGRASGARTKSSRLLLCTLGAGLLAPALVPAPRPMAAAPLLLPVLRPVHEHHGVYHEGELAVQRRVGTYESAKDMGPNMISARIQPGAGVLFSTSPHLFVASQEPHTQEAGGRPRRVWASVLFGLPGFVQVAGDLRHLLVRSRIPEGDPLSKNLVPGAPVATMGINFEHRSRYRINGRVASSDGGTEAQPLLAIEALEAFGNCPKYIAARKVYLNTRNVSMTDFAAIAPSKEVEGRGLTEEASKMVRGADTFFIATAHPERGADLSHRGGHPGFVRVSKDKSEIFWADYAGNGMFQTLGNIEATGMAGVVFIDWTTGSTLQLSGSVAVDWQGDSEKVDGSARVVRLKVEASVFIPRRVPLTYVLPKNGLSPFNPELSGTGAPAANQGGGEQASIVLGRVFRESRNVKTFMFQPVGGSDALLQRLARHQPGEYATLQVPAGKGGEMVSRTWTISSPPGALMHDDPGVLDEFPAFTISVKREEKGLASRYLHDELEIGDCLTVTAVGGGDSMSSFSKWRLAAPPQIEVRTRRILFLSAGIGITPIMSNLRTFMLLRRLRRAEELTEQGLMPQLALIHSTKTLPVMPFAGELSQMLRFGVLSHFMLTVSGARGAERTASVAKQAAQLEAVGVRLEQGRITAELLAQHVTQDKDLTIFLCGPAGFMRDTEEVLHGLGVDPANIRTESFYF